MPPVVRVVVIDDHEIVRGGVRVVLQAEDDIAVVGEAATVEDAVAVVQATDPDIAVVDPSISDGTGVSLVARMTRESPRTRWLVLSRDEEPTEVLAAIQAGAAGHLVKTVTGEVLRSTVRGLAMGHGAVDPEMFRRVLAHVEQPRETAPELAGLTDQQRRILELIARGMTNRQIADELFLAEKTVKNNVTRILAGLGVQRRTQAALVASRLFSA